MHSFFPSNDSPESSNAQSSPPPPPESSKAPMNKKLFYDFLPSKAVEDAERAQNIPHPVTCQLIEIRDVHPLPTSESHDCPTLFKIIDEEEVVCTNDSPESSNTQSSPPPPPESSKAPMNKTLFYDFLPSKDVEDEERAQNIPHPVTCQLIEIRDVHPLPTSESHDCPTLVMVIDEEEVFAEKLFFSHRRAFDYVFRHWPMPAVQAILMGGKYNVEILDCTDNDPGRSFGSGLWFCGESTFFAKLYSNDQYFLNMSEVFQARRVAVGDVIHCRWDTQNECFVLKVVRRET